MIALISYDVWWIGQFCYGYHISGSHYEAIETSLKLLVIHTGEGEGGRIFGGPLTLNLKDSAIQLKM